MATKKNMLAFNEQEHLYVVNGYTLPSVTNILSNTKFMNKYIGVNKTTLGNAATFGTNVHHAIETNSAVGLTPEELHCYMNYLGQVKDNGVISLMKESMVQFNGLYCGTFDEIGLVKREDGSYAFCMLDTKTTAQLDRNYLSWQLSYYALAWKYSVGLRRKFFDANKEVLAEHGITSLKQIREFDEFHAFWIPKKGNGKFVKIVKLPEEELMSNLERYYKFNANVPHYHANLQIDKSVELLPKEVPTSIRLVRGKWIPTDKIEVDMYYNFVGHMLFE